VFSPDVVADIADATHDRLWHDRRRNFGVDAELECLAQQPAVGAGSARDVCSSHIVTDGKQMVASTVKQIGGSRLTEHGCPFLDDHIPSSNPEYDGGCEAERHHCRARCDDELHPLNKQGRKKEG